MFNLLKLKIMANLDINVLYQKYEDLKNQYGADAVLEDFVQQMSSNQLQDLLEQAYTNFDIPFDEEEDE